MTPLTTIDYPGELAAVIFCQGCPWRCTYCQNGHLLPARTPHPIAWDRVREFLERRRGLLDAVVFSGGEPTAQSALPAALAEVRSLGFKVGLHTAGIYPKRLAQLLPLLDWVGLDIKGLPAGYPAITGVPGSGTEAFASLEILHEAEVPYEVRTTVLPSWSADQIRRLAELLAARGVTRYVLQGCETARALDVTLRGERSGLDLAAIEALGLTALFPGFAVRDRQLP